MPRDERGILVGERFRNRCRRGTIVVVRVVNVVRVELHLAVVEVEVRRVVKLPVGVIVLLPPISVTEP
jgi:hypothetical protein